MLPDLRLGPLLDQHPEYLREKVLERIERVIMAWEKFTPEKTYGGLTLAEFTPEPLPYVITEDPRLSLGQDKVVMWSYPVIQDGLIYVVDLRNGLYVLEYNGLYEDEVEDLADPGAALRTRHLVEAEGDVLRHRQVR